MKPTTKQENKNRKTKILFVHNTMKIGGIERALLGILDRLDYTQVDVHLAISSTGNDLMSQVNPNVRIVLLANKIEWRIASRAAYSSTKGRNIKSFWDLMNRIIKAMNRLMQKQRLFRDIMFRKKLCDPYDLAFALNQGNVHPIVLEIANSNKKYAFFHHGNIEVFNANIDSFKKFDGIIVVSQTMATLIKSTWEDIATKVFVMHNIVDSNYVKKLSYEINELLPIADKSLFTICSCGRLHKDKGFDILIEAASILKNKLKMCFQIIIIGE